MSPTELLFFIHLVCAALYPYPYQYLILIDCALPDRLTTRTIFLRIHTSIRLIPICYSQPCALKRCYVLLTKNKLMLLLLLCVFERLTLLVARLTFLPLLCPQLTYLPILILIGCCFNCLYTCVFYTVQFPKVQPPTQSNSGNAANAQAALAAAFAAAYSNPVAAFMMYNQAVASSAKLGLSALSPLDSQKNSGKSNKSIDHLNETHQIVVYYGYDWLDRKLTCIRNDRQALALLIREA